ncbi:hypothetical protein FB451DRAFT_1189595 [Mycena latifolia]|nr:hypothetical protein FB451DRAFT_1189595 [Mycena latifolia]
MRTSSPSSSQLPPRILHHHGRSAAAGVPPRAACAGWRGGRAVRQSRMGASGGTLRRRRGGLPLRRAPRTDGSDAGTAACIPNAARSARPVLARGEKGLVFASCRSLSRASTRPSNGTAVEKNGRFWPVPSVHFQEGQTDGSPTEHGVDAATGWIKHIKGVVGEWIISAEVCGHLMDVEVRHVGRHGRRRHALHMDLRRRDTEWTHLQGERPVEPVERTGTGAPSTGQPVPYPSRQLQPPNPRTGGSKAVDPGPHPVKNGHGLKPYYGRPKVDTETRTFALVECKPVCVAGDDLHLYRLGIEELADVSSQCTDVDGKPLRWRCKRTTNLSNPDTPPDPSRMVYLYYRRLTCLGISHHEATTQVAMGHLGGMAWEFALVGLESSVFAEEWVNTLKTLYDGGWPCIYADREEPPEDAKLMEAFDSPTPTPAVNPRESAEARHLLNIRRLRRLGARFHSNSPVRSLPSIKQSSTSYGVPPENGFTSPRNPQ